MFIIPAIDILNGKCVRLYKGKYEEVVVYHENPLEQAKIFENMGIKRLHIVDLNGAKEGKPTNEKIIKQICQNTKLIIELGGGIRDLVTAERFISYGVDKIVLGSILVKKPDLTIEFINKFGVDHLIAGFDFKDNCLAISGWLENTDKEPINFAKSIKKCGFKEFIFTDISRDGTLEGPNLEFYKKAATELGKGVIASGGIGSDNDIQLLMQIKDLTGVIIGKAYYEHKIDLKKLIV